MLFKRFITLGLLLALSSSALMPLAVFAEEGQSDEEDSSSIQQDDDSQDAGDKQDDDGTTDQGSGDSDGDESDGQDDDGTTDQGSDDSDGDESDGQDDDGTTDQGSDDSDGDESDKDDHEDKDEAYYDDASEAEGADLTLEEEGEVLVEAVDADDLEDEAIKEYTEAAATEAGAQTFLLSVRWGYFLDEGVERPELDPTDWTGTVSFENNTFALPVKMLRFEKGEDGIDFDGTSAEMTAFDSTIHNGTDGLLFKVKTNVEGADENGIENIPSVIFYAVSFPDGLRVSLPFLLEQGEYVWEDGDYAIAFKVWTSEEWVAAQATAQESDMEQGVANDAEKGAWYEHFMNFSVQNGFFGGDRHANGRPMGTIRPGDGITRLELIKVASELASRLDLDTGLAATDCDPKTVTLDASTDWMGETWSRGYVQCIENSGLALTVLDDVIAGDMDLANAPARRWEVVLTIFELLGMDPAQDGIDVFPDLDPVSTEAKAAIEESADLGVVAGYPDGYFRPENNVNRAEMFKIVSLFYEAFSL